MWAPEAQRIWESQPKHTARYYENYKNANHEPGRNEDFMKASAEK